MGYFQVRYDSRVVIYYCRGFIRLATGLAVSPGEPRPLTYNVSDDLKLFSRRVRGLVSASQIRRQPRLGRPVRHRCFDRVERHRQDRRQDRHERRHVRLENLRRHELQPGKFLRYQVLF